MGLVYSFIFISEKRLFPSFWALIPTVSAALILYFYHPKTLLAQFLSLAPLVFIGRISYSLYLWHWPIIVLAKKYLFIEQFTSAKQYLIVGATTFILAVLSYYFIETPARKKKRSFKFSFIAYYLIPTLVIFGVYGIQKQEMKKIDSISIEGVNWHKGKNDFLFLGNHYEKTIEKLTLSITPTAKQVSSVADLFKNLTQVAKSTHTQVALIIGSNKSSIYSEFLPDQIAPSKYRYLDFYLRELKKNKDLIIYDSKPDLISAKNANDFLYYRTDTHWNQKGALIAYQHFLKQLNFPIPNIELKLEKSTYGDLVNIAKLETFPLHDDDKFSVIVDQSAMKCELLQASKGAFGSSEKCTNEKAPVDKYVWVIGDSFTNALKIYLKATFKEVDFLGHWGTKLPVIADELKEAKIKPDMLIVVRVERSF